MKSSNIQKEVLFSKTEKIFHSQSVLYLIYDRFECDLQIVHPCQLHGLIDALGSQGVSPENGVWIPAGRKGGGGGRTN